MKRFGLIIFTLAVLAGIWLVQRDRAQSKKEKNAALDSNLIAAGVAVTATAVRAPATEPGKPAQLIGENILRDYAKTNLPPENDLTLIARLMDNFTILVKSSPNRLMSVNEDWAAAFVGNNSANERFLSDQHASLNAKGQLVDRWHTPLFFHALSARQFEIRSAGPDRILWTDDDIHRNPDGSFRRGSNLNPPSLFNGTYERSSLQLNVH